MKKEIGVILGILVLFGTVALVEPAFAEEVTDCNCNRFGGMNAFADLTEEQQEELKMFMTEQREEMENFMEEQRLEKEEFFSEIGIEIDNEMPFKMKHGFRPGFKKGFE